MVIDALNRKISPPPSMTRRSVSRMSVVLGWHAKDLMRRRGMRALSYGKLMYFFLLKLAGKAGRVRPLMDAHRFYPTPYLTKLFKKNKELFLDRLDTFVYDAPADDFIEAAARSIVLKTPSRSRDGVEKGVLLITFTESLPFYYKYIDCAELLNYFYVVLEPSWSGYCNPNILFWMQYEPSPVIVESSEQKDYSFLTALGTNLFPVEFGASDWVDSSVFYPINGIKKEYDAIYVCTYKPIKRHHVLFKAIRDMQDPTYRAALVCVNWGGAKAQVEALIDHYGVSNNVSVHENCPPDKVNELLNASKVNVLFSLKEGSNRSIFEGFFSNVPCIVLKNNVGVNKDYINAMTGKLIQESALVETLLHFRKEWRRYAPREWALQNIAPVVTTRKLSKRLQEIAHDCHEPWTRDIIPKVNAPEVRYLCPSKNTSGQDARAVMSLFLKANTQKIARKELFLDSLLKLCSEISAANAKTYNQERFPGEARG